MDLKTLFDPAVMTSVFFGSILIFAMIVLEAFSE